MGSFLHFGLLVLVSVYFVNSQPQQRQPIRTNPRVYWARPETGPAQGAAGQCSWSTELQQQCSDMCTRRGCQARPCTDRTAFDGCQCWYCMYGSNSFESYDRSDMIPWY